MEERFETFTVLIAKISRNIRKIKNQEMKKFNLKSSHISCLYFLYCADTLTATELCERCEEDKATISRSLDFLEKNGYITCETKSAKRYKSPLMLTEKGKEAGMIIAKKIKGVLNEISTELTEKERVDFYRCLAIISEGLDAVGKRYDGGVK
ncbi:MAG: MarR family winged helix-turn-helix transcriptional regulator [Clostridia bacterium]|nr:MarR family winged helix-turn-helix transcriptional regulator [Clostridia bacterium]